ncbi:MAG: glucose dehydrogenase [Glaciihabitans sp.]|nr:glucose dehydrogenase [Glaciihabitans sp.]
MRRPAALIALGLAVGFAAAGCTGTSLDPPAIHTGDPIGTPKVIATDLDVPWSMVRLSSGVTLVSERDTALVKEVRPNGALSVVGTVPGVAPNGEGGLLGLAVAASDPGWLYAYETTASDNRVIRMPLVGVGSTLSLGPAETIITGLPFAGNHDGGRIQFGPDGDLYVTVGDATNRDRAQDVAYLGGKILRLKADGSIPSDNPFPGSPVWSLGHRNPQGIAWDSSGRMWAAEFGQDTWDELNIIVPGGNYGWPTVEGASDDKRFINPVTQWSTADASPSGLLWSHGRLYLAALRGERLWVIDPTTTPVRTTAYFTGSYGRLRDVIDGPRGTIWMLTNNTFRGEPKPGDDRILEVRLADLG